MKMHLSYIILAGLLNGGVAFAHSKQPQTPSQNQAEAAELPDRFLCIKVSADFRKTDEVPVIECFPGCGGPAPCRQCDGDGGGDGEGGAIPPVPVAGGNGVPDFSGTGGTPDPPAQK